MIHLFTWAPCLIACTCQAGSEREEIAEDMAWERKKLRYGFDDEYGDQYDEYGNPVPQYDEYGNPIPVHSQIEYDQYGHPMPRYDEYGNPTHGAYHVSAYDHHDA